MAKAPRSNGKTLLVFTYVWQEDPAKIFKVPRAQHKVNPARSITRLVSASKYLDTYISNHLWYHFSPTVHLHLARFYATTYLETNYLGEMLIEQIIEFELRGLGPLAVHVLLQLVIFITKQKSLRNIF